MTSGPVDNGQTEPMTPRWATQPFRDFLDFMESLGEVVQLTIRGISSIQAMPKIVSAIALAEGVSDTDDTKAKLDHATRLAELAEREVKGGFPLLHSQASVTLWGSLETLISTFVASWIQHTPSILATPPFSSIKVNIGDYESLNTDEKAIFLAELLDRGANGVLRRGVSRFDSQIQALGLSGATSDSIRRDLFELNQLRNIIVHKRGIADRKLVEACPWLGLEIGQQVTVTHKQFSRYQQSSGEYVTELICRVAEHFGVPRMRERLKETLANKALPSSPGAVEQIVGPERG